MFQVKSVCKQLAHHLKLRVVSVSDQFRTRAQIRTQLEQPIDLLLATPSRLVELVVF